MQCFGGLGLVLPPILLFYPARAVAGEGVGHWALVAMGEDIGILHQGQIDVVIFGLAANTEASSGNAREDDANQLAEAGRV